jgi:putative glutamine amidotransferase
VQTADESPILMLSAEEKQRPIIGVLLDWAEGRAESYSRFPYYALREHYFEAIYTAGGLPVAVPLLADALPAYLHQLNGVLIPGGDYPFPEHWYEPAFGDQISPYAHSLSRRAALDAEMIHAAVSMDKPVLGICAGMQVLGAVFNCKLTGNVHRLNGNFINHRFGKSNKPAHAVKVRTDTLLHQILRVTAMAVNSSHNEAIVKVSPSVIVNAWAEDGIVEGIEIVGKKFALGVQWHPELLAVTGANQAPFNPHRSLFEAFVQAAR